MDKQSTLQEVMENWPNGLDKLQVLEEWIAAAEDNQDFESSYNTRFAQNQVAMEVGRYDLLMDNFSWCLDHFESHPTNRDVKQLLKQFRWFLRHLSFFPRISIEEINEYYFYYKDLLEKNQYSLRSYYHLRLERALHCGHEEERNGLYAMWQEEPLDETCFSKTEEQGLSIRIAFEDGRLQEGFSMARDILEEKPSNIRSLATIYPYLLLPAWNSDRFYEAKKWQEQGYFLLHKQPRYLIEISHMLHYMTVTDLKRAYRVFLDHITLADECQDLHTRFYFYLASWCMLEKATIEGFHLPEEDFNWFADQVPDIAKEFDERNGNRHYQNVILDWRQDADLL